MLVTLSGIVTLVRLVQLENAEALIVVTFFPLIDEGITTSIPFPEYPIIKSLSAVEAHKSPSSVMPNSASQTTGQFE